ncbi:peptidase [Clostridia bacterium]|nr:peptidase [Clostridia bacterium]
MANAGNKNLLGRKIRVPVRLRKLGLVLLALIAALAIWLLTRDPVLTTPALPALASAELRKESEALTSYDVRASFQADRRTLTARQRITYTNTTGQALEYIYLRTYANAFASPDSSPAATSELYDLCYKKGFSAGGLTLISVTIDNTNAKWSYEDEAGTALKLEAPRLRPGATIVISITYTITLPECAYRFGMSSGIAALNNALPTVAMWDNGEWRLEPYYPIGDPFISECANWRVELTLPEGWRAAASGARIHDDSSTSGPVVFEALAVRDFSLVLSNRYILSQINVNGVTVTAFALSSGEARALARDAASALKLFGELFGPYPWPSYDVAIADIPFGGMESSGLSMIALSSAADASSRSLSVAHETAHQWFHAIAGNDELREPWLDEAPCVYAVTLYIQRTKGEFAFNQYVETEIEPSMRLTIPRGVTIGSAVELFASWKEYQTIVYQRGGSMLLGLRDAMGAEKLNEALRLYIKNARLRIGSRAMFMDALSQVSGSDWSGYMEDYLDTYILGGW